jgi:kynureninase
LDRENNTRTLEEIKAMNQDELQKKAVELDKNDKLAPFRTQFEIGEEIYLDGNSLGRLPKKTIGLITELTQNQWGKRLIRSWNEHWMELPSKVAAKIAQVVGAQPDEIFVGDSTSINFYKLAFAALKTQESKTRIITDSLNFPTDIYVLQGLIEQQFKNHSLTIIKSKDEKRITDEEIENALDHNTALLTLSHVVFKSAYVYDMHKINQLAHQKDSLVLWDLSHSAGAVEVNLNESGVDLAVGCTYKYLNGGPGAPAFLYVRKDLQAKLMNPIWGWFSHQKPFNFTLNYEAKADIQRFAAGTPSVLSLAAMEPGLDLTLEAGMKNLRAKSVVQTTYLIELVENLLTPFGFTIASPINSKERGSHVSIQHPEGYRISRAMIEPIDASTVIIPDFRPPNNIRLGIAPLYNTFEEIFQTIIRIKTIVETREFERFGEERLEVV